MKKTIAVGIIVVLLLSLSVGAFLTLENTEEEKRQIDIPFSTADDPGIDSQITSTTLVDGNLLVKFNNPNHEKVYVEGLVADRYTLKEDKLTVFNHNNESFKLIIGEQSDVYTFGSYPIITYGNGWKKVCSSDGSCTHTDGVKTFQRWDGNYRPWSELDVFSGNYPYLVEEFDTHYLLTKGNDNLTLQKNFGTYTFQPNKIGFSFTETPAQLNARSHKVSGEDYWYIPIPESLAQTTKRFNWDNRLPHVFNESGNTTNQTNFEYHRVDGQLRFYYNEEARNFGAASSLITFEFNSWIVGSGGNAWSGNVSHDGTTEVQCTGKVELRQEVDDYVSYWRMDKGTGNTAFDENETSNNDGIFTDGSTGNWTSSSKYGEYALDFDGTDDYATQSNMFTPPSEYFSIVFWMKGTVNYHIMMWNDAQDGSSSTLDRQLSVMADGAIAFYVYDETPHSFTSATSGLGDGNWHHIVAMVDGDMKLYIDGMIDSNTVAGVSHGYNGYSTPYFLIGKGDNSDANRHYNGTIDEVRIYDRGLSASEINQTRDNEHHTSGNLTSWHDAGSGNETYKLSVNFTFPANTNASINLYNNDTGAFIETLATNNNTEQWSKTITSATQDSKVNITLYGNVTETPEIHNITFHTQATGAATPILEIGNNIAITNDWGQSNNSNISITVSGATANETNVTYNDTRLTNVTDWGDKTVGTYWNNQSISHGNTVGNVYVEIHATTTSSGGTNDTEYFWFNTTKRTNTATMDSNATQAKDVNEDFYINGTCNEEYGDTFYGAADLLEDAVIIDTNSSVTDYVNFSLNESVAGQYNYTVRFYNTSYYDNATTSSYSNVTVSAVGETYNITGYVKNESAIAINNAYVVNNITATDDYTNASGFYNLTGLLNNSYLVTASKAGYVSNSTVVTISGSDMANQNITLTEVSAAPNITAWYNNYTSDNSTDFTITHEDEANRTVFFNVTADQSIDYWVWYVDGVLFQNSSYDNITKTWDEGGNKTVTVYGINANGQTSTLTWDIEIEHSQYEYEKLIYAQNLLLIEENEMIGQTMLFVIFLIIAFVFLAAGYLSPNATLKIFGAAFSSLLFIILAYAIIGNQFGEKLQMAWLATLLGALGIIQAIYTLLIVISLLYMMFTSRRQAGVDSIPFDPGDRNW